MAIWILLATILKVSHIRTGHPISAVTHVWSLMMFLKLHTFSKILPPSHGNSCIRLVPTISRKFSNKVGYLKGLKCTVENRRFDQCILDWTNQCKSGLILVANSAYLQTATAAHMPGPIYEAFYCSGSLRRRLRKNSNLLFQPLL